MLSRLDYPAPSGASDRTLLLMLPPVGAEAADFDANGMVAAVRAAGLPFDIVAAQPDLSLYLDGEVVGALHRQIVEPALALGYRRIWLLGISLGGMGALLYAAEHAAIVEGMILLAPFLGTRGTIASLAQGGGIASAPEPGIATLPERRLLAWLRNHTASGRNMPSIYLGYGANDRFAPGHRMLAEMLPPAHVVKLPGGHDWECWQALWPQILALTAARGSVTNA